MNAEIIQFILRPRTRSERRSTDFSTIAFRAAVTELDADYADTALSEYLLSDFQEK